MARRPLYPDIPEATDLPSALTAIKLLKQAIEALTGSTSQVGAKGKPPADTGTVARIWVTRKDEPGLPTPIGQFDGDLWFIVPGSDPSDAWIKLIWYRGGWNPLTP